MKLVLAALVAVSLVGTASAETVGEKTGVNSALGIAPTTEDFVREAAISDMFEIQSSKLAEQRTQGPTRQFAAHMITDHSTTTSELKTIARNAKVTVPTALDSTHQTMLDKLTSLKGDDFLKRYHSDQDTAHKQAVSLFERYANGGENAALKAWAAKTLPHLQQHYKLAQDLDK